MSRVAISRKRLALRSHIFTGFHSRPCPLPAFQFFAERILTIRKKMGFLQELLAEQSGVNLRTVSYIEGTTFTQRTLMRCSGMDGMLGNESFS